MAYRNRKQPEIRWTVIKDYYRDGINFTDMDAILYGTKEEAEKRKADFEAGCDKSWFDNTDDSEAFLYVDQVNL